MLTCWGRRGTRACNTTKIIQIQIFQIIQNQLIKLNSRILHNNSQYNIHDIGTNLWSKWTKILYHKSRPKTQMNNQAKRYILPQYIQKNRFKETWPIWSNRKISHWTDDTQQNYGDQMSSQIPGFLSVCRGKGLCFCAEIILHIWHE